MLTQFVNGFFWEFSSVVFILGILWRLFSMFRYGTRKELAATKGSAVSGAIRTNFSRFVPHKEVSKKINLQVIAGYMFHVGLFVVLLFAAPHIKFAKEHVLGFGWSAMPYWLFVLSAEIAFLGLLLLLLHRILHPVNRLISRKSAYITTGLVFAVMLTGCMALFQSYTGLKTLHLFSVELLMIYFPFSSLMHAIMFLSSRAYTGSFFGLRGMKV